MCFAPSTSLSTTAAVPIIKDPQLAFFPALVYCAKAHNFRLTLGKRRFLSNVFADWQKHFMLFILIFFNLFEFFMLHEANKTRYRLFSLCLFFYKEKYFYHYCSLFFCHKCLFTSVIEVLVSLFFIYPRVFQSVSPKLFYLQGITIAIDLHACVYIQTFS